MTFYIIHRWGETPQGDWYQWLAKELRALGHTVVIPEMPDTEHPRIKPWVETLAKLVVKTNDHVHFIGHSIGCQTILRYLETLSSDHRVGQLFFVAPWFSLKPMDEESEAIAQPWIETPINSEKVAKLPQAIHCLFSDNDQYVPLEENVQQFENEYNAKTHIFHKKGHFSSEEKIDEIPELLELIKTSL